MANLIQKDREIIWHPYTQQAEMVDPLGIVSGKGTILIDTNGKKIIDAISSWWVTIHGHGHPYIAEKIYEQALQLEQVIFAGFTHEPAVRLADRLLEVLPGKMSKIFYSDNGSTAVEVALKMAIQYWRNLGDGKNPRRSKIIALKNSYHGDTFGAMSVSERGVFTLAFQDYLFDVEFIDAPTKENIDSVCDRIEQTGEVTACFIYEPLVQGAGGMIMTEQRLLNQLLEYCKSKRILCIADEVMTGFGRTGRLFASEYLSVQPDIICLSKGLTGGTMAMGVTACTAEIHSAYISADKTKTLFHGHSFTANPIACASALASMDLIMKAETFDAIRRINYQHLQFEKQLKKSVFFTEKKIQNVRVQGTILAFELESSSGNYLNTIGKKFAKLSLERNVLLRPLGNTVYILPPYCITEEESQKVYTTIIKVLGLL